MDKHLKETIKTVKSLQKKDLLYMRGSISLEVEPNYQVLASIVENLNLVMDKEVYDLINNKEELIYELALLGFKENDLIDDTDIEFMEYIVKEYIDIEDPVLVEGFYIFIVEMDRLQSIYEKALKQIKEEKFKNYIFD
ncbi:hypothetical protein [Clostridium botulinum]|uniref:hypothetical protein n=1 Tax=Clostridium botulinum TaxID=1491 RepID=UPI0004D9154F|nr:hypothetical protein [Clostridium botulinum]KEI05951.1 hypothetical protein Z952_04715 [Clostridium botulinum C/D str. BKT75002]KEI11260.1 hypothetical protein Z954_08670 [Clostridium botulinum C/D str. BKT2873]QPW59803.1 hypothetical protein IG390_08640 [Clostridium botulinum]QPW62282.1 hypothetical protein IG390_15000 [Clostridium phage CWou-2020b]